MGKIPALLVIISLLLSLASCGEPAYPTLEAEDYPSASPSESPSVEPSDELSIEPSASPVMSYEDYFGEQRELQFMSDEYFLRVAGDEDGREDIRRASDGKTVAEGLLFSDRDEPIAPGRVAYTLENREIYLYDDADGCAELLYRSDEKLISNLQGDRDVLFFALDTEIRRLYLPDGSVDFICDTGYDDSQNEHWRCRQGSDGYFRALTNRDVLFFVADESWYAEDAERAGVPLLEYVSSLDAVSRPVAYSAALGKYGCDEQTAEVLQIPEESRMDYEEFCEYLGFSPPLYE